MSAASEIGKFITEWIRTIQATQKAIETKDLSIVRHQVILQGAREGNNFVNREGYNHLQQAACIILRDEKLGQKLSLNTGVNAVVQAHFELLPKAKTKKQFSEQGIANRARELLLAAPRQSGTYVYPLVFAPAATATDWGFGPVRIVSKTIFLGQYKAVFDAERNAEGETIRAKLLEDWEAHAKIYDHYILIEMPDYEQELAEQIGREVAEFFLNLVRMLFRFHHTSDIRIGGGYVFESRRSSLYFDLTGAACFTSSRGPFGTHLANGWTQNIECSLGGVFPLFESYLNWFIAGTDSASPVQERIRYASNLIAEAYCEPHDHIRLVRLISALEAFALVDNTDKAFQLALHCGYVGGRGDAARACAIFDAVKGAYRVRNAIVHGEMPASKEIWKAFVALEEYALDLFVGFVCFFENIHSLHQPQSISQLRRIVKRWACMFFWMPEIAHG